MPECTRLERTQPWIPQHHTITTSITITTSTKPSSSSTTTPPQAGAAPTSSYSTVNLPPRGPALTTAVHQEPTNPWSSGSPATCQAVETVEE